MHIHCAAQLAFVFGAFLRQDVAFERLTAFNSTTWANAKTFFRAALSLHFWHITTTFGLTLCLLGVMQLFWHEASSTHPFESLQSTCNTQPARRVRWLWFSLLRPKPAHVPRAEYFGCSTKTNGAKKRKTCREN